MSVHFENKPEDPRFPMEFSHVHAERNHNGVWMNWHVNIEILHILEGSGYILCGGEHIPVAKGDSVIINSNQIHMFYTLNSTCDYVYLIPGVSFCQQLGIDPGTVQFQTLLHDERVSDLFSSFIAEIAEKSALYPSACRAIAASLLIDLFRKYQVCGKQIKQDAVHAVLLYLQDHYQESITLSEIAGQMGFSLHYLCHLFKKTTGLTIVQYINALRCNRAEALLLSGEYSIAAAASLCGFAQVH